MKGLSEITKSILIDGYVRPQLKAWHEKNSVWNQEESMYYPNPSLYKNDEYHNLNNDEKEILEQFMMLKEHLDELLPENTGFRYKVPQFKGRTMDRLKNTKNSKGSMAKTFFRTNIAEIFVEDSEDTDYGNNQTFNSLEEDIFRNRNAYNREKI